MKKKFRNIIVAAVITALAVPLSFMSLRTVQAETISGGENDELEVDPTGQGDGYAAILYDGTSGLPTSES